MASTGIQANDPSALDAPNGKRHVNLVVDIFFSKEVLRMSCARGLNKGRKLKDTVPLCQPIFEAIIGKFTSEMLFFT